MGHDLYYREWVSFSSCWRIGTINQLLDVWDRIYKPWDRGFETCVRELALQATILNYKPPRTVPEIFG
jgi:hypothetical protein